MAESYQLKNVVFYGRQPLEKMPELYALADVMLVTLEDKPYARMTIPGKVQSYMACGKPIIAAVNGATANLIRESSAGVSVACGDYRALSAEIRAVTPVFIAKGLSASNYYSVKLGKNRFLPFLVAHLRGID